MIPAVVAFETVVLYEKVDSSLEIQPSCLNRPTIVFHTLGREHLTQIVDLLVPGMVVDR